MHRNLRKLPEVYPRPLCQFGLNLIGVHPPRLAHQHGQHGRVVAGARAHVNYVFALPGSQRSQAPCVQARLSIVQSPACAQGDDYILVQRCRIVRNSLQIVFAGCNRPRRWPHKFLPRNRRQRRCNLTPQTAHWIDSRSSHNSLRVRRPALLELLILN